jgi:hypothetical protein
LVGGQSLMEGLTNGWVKSDISGKYHHIRRDINSDELATSSCGFKTRKFAEILKKFEILDVSKICITCELKLKNKKQNDSKKQILTEINEMSVSTGHILKKVICQEEDCNVSGMTFVSMNNEEKPHYCIKHNLRVQLTIQKEKKLEITP